MELYREFLRRESREKLLGLFRFCEICCIKVWVLRDDVLIVLMEFINFFNMLYIFEEFWVRF